MNMTANYEVKGTGLSMIPLSGASTGPAKTTFPPCPGSGPLAVAVKELLVTGENYVVIKSARTK